MTKMRTSPIAPLSRPSRLPLPRLARAGGTLRLVAVLAAARGRRGEPRRRAPQRHGLAHQVGRRAIDPRGDADIDATIVQVDEANLPGHPEDADWAHEPINHVLKGVRGQKGLHLCFGNYGGQSIQKGYWKNLIPFLNALDVDHYVLEFARRGYDELDAFRELRPEIALGLGVIDIKDNEVETPEDYAGTVMNCCRQQKPLPAPPNTLTRMAQWV